MFSWDIKGLNVNAKLVAFTCAMAWTTLSNTIALADTTADIIDGGPLKKNGAQQLKVLFEDSADDKPQHAWLQGVTNEKVLWKKPLPLKFFVNTAKTDVIDRKSVV